MDEDLYEYPMDLDDDGVSSAPTEVYQAMVVAAADQVDRGAAFLDSHPKVAEGWRERIDPETFDITDGSHCILPQATGLGTYALAADYLFDNGDHYGTSRRNGFMWGLIDGVRVDSDTLNQAWREYLWPDEADQAATA